MLGEIYAQGLRAAGYDVTKLDLGDEHVALKAVESGEIDAYPEYTGTALRSFFGMQPDELPKDPRDAYAEAKQGFAKRGSSPSRPRRSAPPTRSRSPRRQPRSSRCRRSRTSRTMPRSSRSPARASVASAWTACWGSSACTA